uniref:Uncharacterized protein n=1 Tax=Arundo donax TaxID=35708 RepID=A0A0A9H8C2_ARUDO
MPFRKIITSGVQGISFSYSSLYIGDDDIGQLQKKIELGHQRFVLDSCFFYFLMLCLVLLCIVPWFFCFKHMPFSIHLGSFFAKSFVLCIDYFMKTRIRSNNVMLPL